MKKTKLNTQTDSHKDFSIFAISTTMADYKLAFELNHHLVINLAKQRDLPVYISGKTPVYFPFFYDVKDEQTEFFLIEDKSSGDAMVKSFLTFVRGFFSEDQEKSLLVNINNISDIFSCNPVILDEKTTKKSKNSKYVSLLNNIISDLEYHLMEIQRMADDEKVKLKPTQNRSSRKLYN